MKNFLFHVGSKIATFALLIVAMNINSACTFIHHQSKMPETAKKLRKF